MNELDKIEDLYCILYVSTSKINCIKDELELFQQKNRKNNISGLMLYYEGNIIQYIEGNKKELYNLYNKIKIDSRHHNIIKVMDEKIIKRNFVSWDMGFKELSYIEFKNFSLDKLMSIDNNFDIGNKKVNILFVQFIESFSSKYIIR